MKEFKGLLISEVKKAEKLANKVTGFDDCKVTGYSPVERNEFCECWIDCKCEICRNYKDRVDIDIMLVIPMFDRRMSWAYCNIDDEIVKVNGKKKRG